MAAQVTTQQRKVTLAGIAYGTLATLLLWYLLIEFLPAPAGAGSLDTALTCSAIAALLTVLAGVEAVAHERLFTPAIDPLAGVETPRMRVNFRFLSNTVEQFIIFAAGLLALAAYAPPRILIIVTIVWVIARWAFWIGYHRSPLLRGLGAPGMLQSMLVLLYVAYRFLTDSYGPLAGVAVVILFGAIEAILFWVVLRRAQ